jgi:hypothetical protein
MTAVPVPSAVLRATAAATYEGRIFALREALIQAKGAGVTVRSQRIIGDALDADDAVIRAAMNQEAPAVPYTDPRKGDRVELRLTGTLTGKSPCDEVDHSVEADCVQLWEFREDGTDVVRRINPAAFGDGRVTLIERAAAPQYQPGRIYRSESTGETYLYSPDGELALKSSPWFRISIAGWVFDDDLPADLVLMDLVPAAARTSPSTTAKEAPNA